MILFPLLLASTLVARSLAFSPCHHPGYVTTLTQGRRRADVLRSLQDRHYYFDATASKEEIRKDEKSPSANIYIKLATCTGTVSVRLFDPLCREINMKGRDCRNTAERDKNKVKIYNNKDSQWDGSRAFQVHEEHTIWTYQNTTALVGRYTIVVTAQRTPCGEAEYQLLASSKTHRQPPILPEDTCVYHNPSLTSATSIGLSWSPAQLPSISGHQIMRYCVYMIPTEDHSHQCGSHGSRCSVSFMRSPNTLEMCFTGEKRGKGDVKSVIRNLKPDTEYHVDVIAWTYDKTYDRYNLPMAYSASDYISTLPERG